MTDPLKVIRAVGARLGRQAALRALIALLPAAVLMTAAAGWLGPLAAASWERWGFALDPRVMAELRYSLLAGAIIAALIALFEAYRAFGRESGLLHAAELVDDRLNAHQEMITFAGLSGAGPARRSALFPLLWRQAAGVAENLNPAVAFPLRLVGSAGRGCLVALATAAVLAAAIALVVVNLGNPLLAQAHELRKLASQLRKPGAGQRNELARQLAAAAAALENPALTPKARLAQLAAIKSEIEKQQQNKQVARNGNASGSERGHAEGKGQSEQGKGSGQAKEGSGGSGQGKTGESGGEKNKGEEKLAEASKDLSRAEMQIAEENGKSSKPLPQPNQKGQQPAPAPGQQKTQAGARLAENQHGPAPQEHRLVSEKGSGKLSGKESGKSRGDTHLGEMPASRRFQRFYKAGEKGPPLAIKDARYVVFRIPPAAQSEGNGRTVFDKGRPSATVPYQNLPLGQERIKAEPDQEQLVPPRYRDLLR